jgi:hypothetical protein
MARILIQRLRPRNGKIVRADCCCKQR